MVFFMINGYDGEKSEVSGLTTGFSMLCRQLAVVKQMPPAEMTGERFFEFLTQGDPSARALLDRYNRDIALVIFNAAMLLDLDRIVVSGGLCEQKDIIEGINKSLEEIPLRLFAGVNPDVLKSILFDEADLKVPVKKGELARDANLYGALYYMLRDRPGNRGGI
jgi:predicted NBD/HSP70 family sugar kinase